MAAAKTLTPEQRSQRARNAARAAHSLDNYIEKLVDRAPELTEEQKVRLAAVFRPVMNRGAAR